MLRDWETHLGPSRLGWRKHVWLSSHALGILSGGERFCFCEAGTAGRRPYLETLLAQRSWIFGAPLQAVDAECEPVLVSS